VDASNSLRSHALTRHPDEALFLLPALRTPSPISDMQQDLEKKRIADDELDRFFMGEPKCLRGGHLMT